MKRTPKYVGLDVHQATTVTTVREETGRVIARWCLAGAPAVASFRRERRSPARSLARLHSELANARHHFGMPADAPVVLCYEACRDGFRG